jgi:hypothetical protein
MSISNYLFSKKQTAQVPNKGIVSIDINYRKAVAGDVISYGDKAFLMGKDNLFRPYDTETGKVDNSQEFESIPE